MCVFGGGEGGGGFDYSVLAHLSQEFRMPVVIPLHVTFTTLLANSADHKLMIL